MSTVDFSTIISDDDSISHQSLDLMLITISALSIIKMWSYIIGVLVLLAFLLLYKMIILPVRLKNYYANLFRKHGFRVYELPYRAHTSPFYEEWGKSFQDKRDAFFKHRHVYCNYDVIVTNSLRNPEVILLNPELILELVSPEKFPII